jgi:hypothetical protein
MTGDLQTDHVRDMLIGGRLFFMRPFPALQIPNFKTPATPHQGNLAFQSHFLAKVFRQNEPALFIGRAVLRARMQLTKKNAPVARGNIRIRFRGRAHTGKLRRRHDQEKLMTRFRKNDELLGAIASPARGYRDAIFFVDEMTELAGIEELRWRRRVHVREED